MHDAMLDESAAMDRLAATAHRTAAFRAPSRVLAANVAYAPDGSWYLIVVRRASHALRVAWMHDGAQTMSGEAVPHGRVAMLYLPKSHRMEQLAPDGRSAHRGAGNRYDTIERSDEKNGREIVEMLDARRRRQRRQNRRAVAHR